MADEMVPDVTILIPAKNEEATIEEVIQRLLKIPMSKQIVVIDDASTDKTFEICERYSEEITLVKNPTPGGKGLAIRAGLRIAEGKVVIIQDADLEYKPEQIPRVVEPILNGETHVCYGTRFASGMNDEMAFANKLVNQMLAGLTRSMYKQKITDEATCYKAVETSILRRLELKCKRFEFCPEVTAKVSCLGYKIKEVPISYSPRTKKSGKKIRWTDGIDAIYTLMKYQKWKPTPKDER